MRLLIPFSALLLSASLMPAQDSPITVADSGSRIPPGTKNGKSSNAFYIQHSAFEIDYSGISSILFGPDYYIQDIDDQNKSYLPACIRSFPSLAQGTNPVPLTGSWTLKLSDNVTLSWNSGKQRIDIDFKRKHMTTQSYNADQRFVIGDQLTFAQLDKPSIQYDADPTTHHLQLDIHYCPQDRNGAPNCKNPTTGADPCQK